MPELDTDLPPLAAAFAPTDRAAWRALVDAALKGAPYEEALTRQLAEGIRTEPIYTAAQAPAPADSTTRNAGALERTRSGWDIRQRHAHPDPAQLNRAVLDDLQGGARSIQLRFDRAARRGGTAASDPHGAGVDGAMIHSLADLETALAGVYLEAAPVALQPGGAFPAAAAMLMALWQGRGREQATLLGQLGADPLGTLAGEGMLPVPAERALADMAALAADVQARYPLLTTVAVDTAAYHAAGADEAMDLAYAMATGVAYLRAMERQGLSVELAAAQIEFSLPVGVDVFLAIAKLRAARRLWAGILGACGLTGDARRMRLHVTTAGNAWAARDAWVNMLRATVATFAGAVGGADSLTVLAYSHALGLPDGFARRIARNTQIVLAEESNLARVIDPAGGSWYVESLSEQLAANAWARFQAIEAAGGMLQHLVSGAAAAECAAAWGERERRIAERREQLVGVSAFAKIDEPPVDVETVDRPALVAEARKRLAAGGGGPTTLIAGDGDGARVPAPAAHRLGEAFEALRDAADRHEARTGTRPGALLVALGGPARAGARAVFARNHLATGGIAGIDIDIDGDTGGDQAPGLGDAMRSAGTDLAVICSSDSIYAERAAATAAALKAAGAREVLLVGRPGVPDAAWRAAGLDGYIFAGDDTLAAMRGVLARLGVALGEEAGG